MDAFERAQKIADIRPHPFRRVAVHFANPIAIVIARIFMNAMFNRCMRADDVIVTVRFVGVDNGFGVSELMHMGFQGFAGRVRNNAQPDLPALPPNGSDNRRAIICLRPAPALVVRTTTRRI